MNIRTANVRQDYLQNHLLHQKKRERSALLWVSFLNNKYNIDHWENIDDSYQGSYTNVASLWDMYETSLKNPNRLIDKVYIKGPGTASPIEVRPTPNNPEGLVSSEKSDSMMGYAYAAELR